MSERFTNVLDIESQTEIFDEAANENQNTRWGRDDIYPLVAANANALGSCYWMPGIVTLSEAMTNYPSWHLINEDNQDTVIAEIQQFLANAAGETTEPQEEETPTEQEHPEELTEKVKLEEEKLDQEEESNWVTKTEKLDEEIKPGEEVSTNEEAPNQKSNGITEDINEAVKTNTADVVIQSKKEIEEHKHPEFSVNTLERTSKRASVTSSETAALNNHIQSDLKQSFPDIVKAEATGSSSNNLVDTTINGSTSDASEEVVVASSTSGNSARETTVNNTGQESIAGASSVEVQLSKIKSVIKSEVEEKPHMSTFEISAADAIAKVVKEMPAEDSAYLANHQEAEPLTLSIAIEATTETEHTELSTLDFESIIILDDTAELSDEKNEEAEDESALEAFDYQTDTNSLVEFSEEVTINHTEETDLEADEVYESSNLPAAELVEVSVEADEEILISQLGNEPSFSGQMEIIRSEQVVQTSFPIEEIEESLIQLNELIEANKPETTEKVNEILDKIIEVPPKLKIREDASIITESEAQEELKELFAELLDTINIDYTPEFTESLTNLTLKSYLAEEIEKLKNEEPDEGPQDSGTHEIIKKLLVGLSIIKKAMTHASTIGKSALQLYAFKHATLPS